MISKSGVKRNFLEKLFCIQAQAYKSQLYSCEKLLKNIQKTDHSISEKTHQTEKKLTEEDDEWSQECLEYLFDNKIWFPVFVRSEFLSLLSFFVVLARTTVFGLDTALAACHRCSHGPYFCNLKYV